MDYLQKISISRKPDDRLKKLSGKTIKFLPGLNFIIGENGIGKSGLLYELSGPRDKKHSCIKLTATGALSSFFSDTEKMNPRVSGRINTTFDIHSKFMSHGECMILVLKQFKDLTKDKSKSCLVIVDEPEGGLSPWKQKELLKIYTDHSNEVQFIIATHSLIFTKSNVGRLIELTEEKINYYDPPSTYDWGI